jgi:hypothetical protein
MDVCIVNKKYNENGEASMFKCDKKKDFKNLINKNNFKVFRFWDTIQQCILVIHYPDTHKRKHNIFHVHV